jgi:hypothetical protein
MMQSSEDRPPRDVHRQKSWKARRCQLIRVPGFTTTTVLRQGNQRDQNSSANLAESISRRGLLCGS